MFGTSKVDTVPALKKPRSYLRKKENSFGTNRLTFLLTNLPALLVPLQGYVFLNPLA